MDTADRKVCKFFICISSTLRKRQGGGRESGVGSPSAGQWDSRTEV